VGYSIYQHCADDEQRYANGRRAVAPGAESEPPERAEPLLVSRLEDAVDVCGCPLPRQLNTR
jgi:hypothetical protein